jgi:uncharacterized protein (DUF2236 family)
MFKAFFDLMRPPAGLDIDFTAPPGAPALAPADGVSWRVFANPVSLFVGGVTAVLLELAEPSVRTGVWEHSSFRRDPAGRLRRTGFAAMVTVYGPREPARQMIARVVRLHEGVQGHTPGGLPYRANDPRLLDWVQATAVFGFTQAYHAYVASLSPAEQSAAFAEGQAAARLYGATQAPADSAAWERLLARTAPLLEGSPILTEFLDIMTHTPLLPWPLRPLQRLLVRAAVEITPEPVRSLPELRGRGLRRGERTVVRLLGRAARRWPLRSLPPAQAARRMGVSL